MAKKIQQSNPNENYVKDLTQISAELEQVRQQWRQLGFSNEAVGREQMKLFAEKIGNQLFLDTLTRMSQVDPDSFLKHYISFAKIVYPTMKAEDSKQKNLQITIMGSESTKVSNVIANPSRMDLPFNFDELESPLDRKY
jgi:hypothetical protein